MLRDLNVECGWCTFWRNMSDILPCSGNDKMASYRSPAGIVTAVTLARSHIWEDGACHHDGERSNLRQSAAKFRASTSPELPISESLGFYCQTLTCHLGKV